MPLLICSPYSTDGRITSDFITQSKPLGGSTPQPPRWGRGAAPKPPAH
ncbi:Mobile element protein [Microcystis aeruginosa NIES-2549]|uniref:Mobile element protein n=1 Tax=Microcystis aeruginosa NIES-2549 TaxID=1641812 RepID=A0A0F6RK53_MICAE|nr:Mobile element protein [Microcystis aeruginosa NIES-2549]